jgi:hypothetical protein
MVKNGGKAFSLIEYVIYNLLKFELLQVNINILSPDHCFVSPATSILHF